MMSNPAPQEVIVGGKLLRRGSRVRLQPAPRGDLYDGILAGRIAVIEGIDEDDAGAVHVSVTLEDDPGRDLASTRHPTHRFFFSPSELEPVDGETDAPPRRVLVAGIGNVFFGDDGFGVAVTQQLAKRNLPRGVQVVDFGIRGTDLAFTLGSGFDAAILVDASPRGGPPGSIYILEPELPDDLPRPLDSHQMDPLAVLGVARALGPLPELLLVVGCEPENVGTENDSIMMELSAAVAAAVERGAEVVAELATRIARNETYAIPATL